MRLCCISDLHGMYERVNIPEADVLIVAGDVTGYGQIVEVTRFIEWLSGQPAEHKIFVGGNHDRALQKEGITEAHRRQLSSNNIHYLQDRELVIDGIKFYGSPHSPEFMNWYFMYERGEEARAIWSLIPEDTDVLITHTPPKGILDRCAYDNPPYPQDAGCEELLERIKVVKPKLSISGHIHEGRGMDVVSILGTKCINASICTLDYQPVNRPIMTEIKK